MPVQVSSFERLQRKLHSATVEMDVVRLQKAWDFAQNAYEAKEHWTGVPLMDHVLNVLGVLLPFQPDEEIVLGCLLHQVLHSKYCTVGELEQQFGSKICELVSGVHLISHVTLQDRRVPIEDLKLMFMTVSDDIRTIVIVLCDRLVLLQQASTVHTEYGRRSAQEALQIFAPVAARLGIYTLKHDIERIAFPLCYPQDAERIIEQMAQAEERYGNFLQRSAERVRQYLQEKEVVATVEARKKLPYSVFRKMREKSITHILDLYDYYAIRVIVENDAECYQVLGHLHKLGRPVGNRFKDYIAFPKPNGYRSLHTTLAHLPCVPGEALLVEVQVRTQAMNREALYGVAAHWMYKESGVTARAVEKVHLHNVLASQDTLEDANELADHIYVLTPAGDVLELPEGATPLDFAFQLHTDLGIAFRGARVNGTMVSMDYHLENGDSVEILKQSTPQPSPQWVQLLKMASSRAKLKRYLYAQNRPELLTKGREALNAVLRKHSVPPLDTSLSLLRKVNGQILSMQEREDVLVKLGQGSEKSSSLLPKLDVLQMNLPVEHVHQQSNHTVKQSDHLVIQGGIPLPHRYAKCCKPAEGARVSLMGVVNRKGEVVVHKQVCRLLRNANPERKIRVWWEE